MILLFLSVSKQMILRGVRIFSSTSDSDDEEKCLTNTEEGNVPEETLRVMIGCHALAIAGFKRNSTTGIVEPAIVGDPLEMAVLKKTGYNLVGNNVVKSPEEDKAMVILHRFAFSSKLKRMTVLASYQGDNKRNVWALTKGAPETIKELLHSESIPSDYDKVAFYHMSRGRRVLAMGYRQLGDARKFEQIKGTGRDSIERDLTFAGFLVLDCPLKPDTKKIMNELKDSGHQVVMITGDATLTAVEVARQVEMIPRSSSHRVYRIQFKENQDDNILSSEENPLTMLEAVDMNNDETDRLVFSDFGRVKQEGKASFSLSGDCLMKLVSMTHHSGSWKEYRSSNQDEKALLMGSKVQRLLKELVSYVSVFARHAPYQKEAVVAAFNRRGFTTLMVGDGTNDVGALKCAHVGISIVSAPEVEAKQRESSKAFKNAKKKGKAASKRAQDSLKQWQDAQQELDEVELGDASVAAPFTSRSLTIKCVKDVIQQGRCTLVTMLQIYKILGINCLVNAMVLSRLFLHGVKQGDWQLTILGTAVAALFYFVTRAEPLATLSPRRPPSSVLCFEALVSIALQCIVHLVAILVTSETALAFVDPYDPSLVPDGPFNPNVLNSCTFLVLCLITVNTFAVNYRGHPFMQSLSENKFLYRSLQACYAVLIVCSLEIFPPLNDLMQLTALPSVSEVDHMESNHPLFELVRLVGFQVFLPALMVVDTVLAFSADRIVRKFAV
jgi:cation-transporting ATPase 13A1